ncbi:MAG: MMPL family transporter, partial [Actinomycetota bacterium]|nr:MMPL family transporter [Actinomycetota bacterium]
MRRPSVNDAYEALARFVVRFRWAVAGFWLLVAVVTSATLPSLSSQINDNNSAFLQKSAPSTKAANLAAPLLGGGAGSKINDVTIIGSRSGPLTGADLAALGRVASLVRTEPSVVSANELGISSDRQAALIRVRVALSANDITKDKTVVDSLESTFQRASPPAGLQLHLAGQVATLVANQASSARSGGQVQSFSFRTALASSARASGAIDNGVAGEAAAVYDISNTANHDLATVIPV